MKKIREDGTVTYYYYKKKVGRKKKRGPRKKKKLRGRRWQEPWDFKIVLCDFKKQKQYIGNYHNLEEVEYVRKKLIEENDKVIFPKKFSNCYRNNKKISDFESEYVILKKVRDQEKENNISLLRNEYGRFSEFTTTSEKWAIYDKFPHLVEETFWVYGYNPKTERKTFSWILENLIDCTKLPHYYITMVYLYNNKVIIQYDDDFNFVICKNISDAIRFYNLLEQKTNKNRNIVLIGKTEKNTERSQSTFKMLKEKTGWSDTKIYRTSTRS